MQEILRFKPLYQERVWGGRILETKLERALPPERPIGESWEIVDRPQAQSVIATGSLAGRTLREAIERDVRGQARAAPAMPGAARRLGHENRHDGVAMDVIHRL